MPSRPSNTKMSKGKTNKADQSNRGETREAATKARAHRGDTHEAMRDKARMPKTHPTRAPSSSRKDK